MMKLLTAFAFAFALSVSSASFALDSSFEAQARSGTHVYYVWCTGKDDYTAEQEGSDARVAQQAIARKSSRNCWPVWQGLQN